MIKETDIKDYRQIKAPEELKASVLAAVENTPKKRFVPSIKAMTAVAACLLVLLVCVPFLRPSLQPATVTAEAVAASDLLYRNNTSIVLVIECDGRIEVSTEDDSFFCNGVQLKSLKNVNNRLELTWVVSDDVSHLKVNGELFEVSYSKEDGNVNVSKVKK